MKKNAILVLMLCVSLCSCTDNDQAKNKSIEVVGSAEQEVLPDRILIGITLQEYMKDASKKVDILVLEAQLQKAIADAGLSKEDLAIGSIYGEQTWWRKKKPTNFLESKTYILTVPNLAKIDGILNRLDERAITGTNINSYDYSKMAELRKEVKIKALQAAKAKAEYLLEGINESLGDALEVSEIEVEPYNRFQQMESNVMPYAANTVAPIQESTVASQKIKVRYEIKASFKIK
jgi:uncharacterized protein